MATKSIAKKTKTDTKASTVEKTKDVVTTSEIVSEDKTTETAKVVAQAVKETIEQLKTDDTKKETKVKKEQDFASDDLIICRSVTEGTLYLGGSKSGMLYTWSGFGDVQEVEFQDLRALMYRNSGYLTKPLIVIDNEELLSLPKWKTLNSLYSELFGLEDLDYIFNSKPDKFKTILTTLPEGMKSTIKAAAGERISTGKLDSLSKIKILDEVLGTDLVATLVK